MATTEQQLGALQADVSNLKEDMHEAKEDRKALRADVIEIKQILAEAKGYWKMGLLIAGFAGAIGSFVTWVLSWLPSLPKH